MRIGLLAVVALLIAATGIVLADVPVPKPSPKEPSYPLVIEAGDKVLEARIIIPVKMLGKIRTSAEQDDEEQGAALDTPRLHTVMSGLALALALAFSGLWLVRRGHVGGRALILMFGSVAFLGIGAMVWADVRVPLPPVASRTDKVIVEIVSKGDSVKLIINKDKLAKLLEAKEKR